MFGKLLSRLKTTQTSELAPSPGYDTAKLRMLFKHFPIGRKLRYFPEYHREAVLDTIVIAYRANDHYIYTNEEVSLGESDASRQGFRFDGDEWLPLRGLKSFQIVVPDTSDSIKQLDYFTRAELGPAGQFRQGNTITLSAESAGRGVPTVDTHVFRRLELRDGPYAGNQAILLVPDFSSLAVVDKRRHQRVQTLVAAQLYYGREGRSMMPCLLQDFSEHSLRVGLVEADQTLPPMKKNDTVFVEFFLSDNPLPYRFQGKVMRYNEQGCVIRVELHHCGGEFRKPSLVDLAEIKTLLLNSATTH